MLRRTITLVMFALVISLFLAAFTPKMYQLEIAFDSGQSGEIELRAVDRAGRDGGTCGRSAGRSEYAIEQRGYRLIVLI
ncbi:hypothetical protein [Paraburkholderia adhaesiva]|uniref:hypothetical protein n=1 Tax=Paraburkholderia adhaesiva TaxID=2883244 RepID=UPI001F3E6D32|nr:hypothetical protein [Paraburkholderia adhaesiva]